MPLSNSQRQERLRGKRTADGLKELRNLWVHPDDEAAIRAYANQLSLRRRPRKARTPRKSTSAPS
jgi:hypothetical protein